MFNTKFRYTNSVLLVLFLFALVSPVVKNEFVPGTSSYSFRLGVLDCDNLEYLRGCRHEIAHKMDDDLGMPSLTTDFAITTQSLVAYMMISGEIDDTTLLIGVYPDRNPRELYAAIYSSVNGDISKLPQSLRKFYSDDPKYLYLYDCLAQTGFNICGQSFSFLKGETK